MRTLAESKIGSLMADVPVAAGQALQIIRRRLSTTLWRSQTNLMWKGLKVSGPGGAEAYRRRKADRCAYDEGVDEVRAAWEVEFGWRGPGGSLSGDGRGKCGY